MTEDRSIPYIDTLMHLCLSAWSRHITCPSWVPWVLWATL